MKYSLLFIIAYVNWNMNYWSQDSVQKHIQFNGIATEPTQKDVKITLADSNVVTISKLKCYLTSFQFYSGNQLVFEEKNSYHLVDLLTSSTINITLPKNLKYTTLKFAIGVDSITTTNGAIGGDLDPTKGMYWTWQSGYINVMMEGTCSNCATRNKEFNLHLGGYQYPNNAWQQISFSTLKKKTAVSIAFDLSKWLSLVDLSSNPMVMSPSKNAVQLALLFSQCFYLIK